MKKLLTGLTLALATVVGANALAADRSSCTKCSTTEKSALERLVISILCRLKTRKPKNIADIRSTPPSSSPKTWALSWSLWLPIGKS